MHPALNEQLTNYAQAWRDAPHGHKDPILAEAVGSLGLSKSTVYRKFKELVVTNQTRKRRTDAGTSALTREEALTLSGLLLEHMRKNGKYILTVEAAIDSLRANDMIQAARTHSATGEITPLSTSAITDALRRYRVHPEQLLRPAPAVRLASLHPNHVWQIDASRCVMYYLPTAPGDNGLRVAHHNEFYKNKPANLVKAIKASLWRYCITDHRSSQLYVEYVTGGESAENISNVLINCMAKRPGEAMHGVPTMLMMDPGSANISAVFRNLCQSMRIRMQVNAVGQPRAKGQVEKAQDIVERGFESSLKTLRTDQVQTIEQINAFATRWRIHINGASIVDRHGMTRDQAWLHITPEQLIIAPSIDIMRELAVTAPESRVVSTFLTVNYLGSEYDVSDVPGVMVGEKLMICRNPSAERGAQAIGTGEDGLDVYYVLTEKVKDDFGQYVDAPIIGETYQSHADTGAQTAAKEIERLVTGTDNDEAAAAARKAKVQPFGGRYDPFKYMDAAPPVPATLPRRGTDHELVNKTTSVIMPPLTHIQAVKQLKPRFEHWSSKYYEWVIEQYPTGIPADDLDKVEAALRLAMRPSVTPLVRVA